MRRRNKIIIAALAVLLLITILNTHTSRGGECYSVVSQEEIARREYWLDWYVELPGDNVIGKHYKNGLKVVGDVERAEMTTACNEEIDYEKP